MTVQTIKESVLVWIRGTTLLVLKPVETVIHGAKSKGYIDRYKQLVKSNNLIST